MKKKIFKLSILLIMTAVLVCSLSCCGLINFTPSVDSVKIVTPDSIEFDKTTDSYSVTYGQEVDFTFELSGKSKNVVTISWTVMLGDHEIYKLDNATATTLSYKFEKSAEHPDESEYSILLTVNDITALPISVKANYRKVADVALVSSTHQIIDDKIQLDKLNLENVTLSANYDADTIDPGLAVTFAWFKGSDELATGTKSITFMPLGTDNNAVYTLKVTFGDIVVEQSVTLSIVQTFNTLDRVKIELGSGAIAVGDIYKQTAVGGVAKSVSVSAISQPSNTVLSTPAKWTLRSLTGTKVLSDTDRSISFVPELGKNILSCEIDNILSRQIIINVFSSAEYENEKAHLENTYLWYGETETNYLIDQTDLENYIGYVVSKQQKDVKFEWKLAKSEWLDGINTSETFNSAVSKAIDTLDESGSFKFSYSANSIELSTDSVFGNPTGSYPATLDVEQQKALTNYSKNPNSRSSLPIDSNLDTMLVKNSNDLFRAVGEGFRPTFESNTNGTKLSALYTKARQVMFKIVDNDMSDQQKVLAIYDWIVTEVDYDHSIYAMMGSNSISTAESVAFNSFYLEGVFDDHKAVCDGKSKAFTLMCGIENIYSKRIIGKAMQPGAHAGKSIKDMTDAELAGLMGHAWNKVLVEVNESGTKEWFVIDTTWGDAGISSGDPTKKSELKSYEYFLADDSVIEDTHLSTVPIDPACDTVYDFYANSTVVSNGYEISLRADTESDFEDLVDASDDLDVGLQIKIDIADVSGSADVFAMFNRIGNAGQSMRLFTLDSTNGIYFIIVE